MVFLSGMAINSVYRVKVSVMVRMYLYPWLGVKAKGSGTMSVIGYRFIVSVKIFSKVSPIGVRFTNACC